MKRTLSLLLVAIFIVGLFMIPTSALSPQKIDEELLTKISSLDENQTIKVNIWLSYEELTEEEIDSLVFEKCGLTRDTCVVDHSKYNSEKEANEAEIELNQVYHKARITVNKDFHSKKNEELLRLLEMDNSDFDYVSTLTPLCVGIELTKEQLLTLSESEFINEISCYTEDFDVSPMEPLYKEEFCKQYNLDDSIVLDYVTYNEKYYHKNEDQVVDWVLCFAQVFPEPWETKGLATTNGLAMLSEGTVDNGPWKINYGIYDVASGLFYELVNAYEMDIFNGLEEYLLANDIAYVIGDINGDDKLSIIDSTYMQQCLSKTKEYPQNDDIFSYYLLVIEHCGNAKYISDYNQDGVRDILDATDLQKSIAKLG